jgi:hypothetical protein
MGAEQLTREAGDWAASRKNFKCLREEHVQVIKNMPISHRINANERGTRKRAHDKSMRVESSTVFGVGLSIGCSVGRGGQIREAADAARAGRLQERALPDEVAGSVA